MNTTQMTAVAIGLVSMCATVLAAQTQETRTTTTTKIELKDGKDTTVIGCVTRSPNGDFILTKFSETRLVAPVQYMLVSDDSLTKHMGTLVEIKGKAVTDGKGRVKIEAKTNTDIENGKDQATREKSEGAIGAFQMPFLGVDSLKTLSSSCN